MSTTVANATTTSKNAMTQAQALRYLIDHASANTPEEVITTAEKLYTAKTKKYERKSDTPTKQQIINNNLAKDVLAFMIAKGEPVSAKIISENVRDVRTPQKAVALARILLKDGSITKFVNDKKQTLYRLPDQQ